MKTQYITPKTETIVLAEIESMLNSTIVKNNGTITQNADCSTYTDNDGGFNYGGEWSGEGGSDAKSFDQWEVWEEFQ